MADIISIAERRPDKAFCPIVRKDQTEKLMGWLWPTFNEASQALAAAQAAGRLDAALLSDHLETINLTVDVTARLPVDSGAAIAAKFAMADWSNPLDHGRSISLDGSLRDALLASAWDDLAHAAEGRA